MYSSKDYEKLWRKYQTEGIAHNMTLQMFCSMNNVPYNSFEKYLKTRCSMSDIHQITVTDIPEEETKEQIKDGLPQEPHAAAAKETASEKESQTRVLVSIRMTNGMQISQGNLNYRGLCRLVEKLEALERKNRMHHASHRWAEASCVIRSVVETCRLWGKSVRDFFLSYFSGVVSGRADYDALMPWANTATC